MMKDLKWIVSFVFFLVACKIQPSADRNHAGPDKIFALQLRPLAGSKFSYSVHNDTRTKMEVSGKTIENVNKSDAVVLFSIDKDSSGNTLVGLKYQKLHIYLKKNDEETEIDGDNAETSFDPTDKFLAALKKANIVATVSPAGQIKSVSGYREVVNEMLPELNIQDPAMRTTIQKQWQQMVEENMIRKNINQLFKIFPDSAVHIGDHWKIVSREQGGINFMIKHAFILKSISDGVAYVESRGEIASDSASTELMGYSVSTDLKGDQNGEYEIDIKSGMMLDGDINTDIEGTVQSMGQNIPLKIKVAIKIEGKKL